MTGDDLQAELLDHAHSRTDAATRGRRNRSRGNRAEVQVVRYLRDHGWPDARRYLAGDGRQPGDLDWHPLVCAEVKDVASSAWPTWCRQAAAEARPGMIPMVVRRTRGVPDVGQWECRIDCWAWTRATEWEPIAEGTATVHEVDGRRWHAYPFAAVVGAVARLDQEPVA